MALLTKCPKCGSTNFERTGLGELENVGAHIVSGAGFIATKLALASVGMKCIYQYGKVAKFFPKEYKCKRCGHTWHAQEHV